MDRDKLILETFELSREIGYHRFLAENFHRADPVLTQLSPAERKAFLRDWWEAARARMFGSYLQEVSGDGVNELLDLRETCVEVLDAIGVSVWRRDQAASERDQFQKALNGTVDREEKPQERSKDRGRDR